MYVKCSEDSERKKRKIAIFNDPTLIWRPSPCNSGEYLYKPYTARNYIPWATFFVADSIWVALQMFEQFCPKAGDANPLVAEPATDFNAKLPFKVIQGHLFRYRWRATTGLYSTT